MTGIIIGTAGIKQNTRQRAQLIADVLDAWWEYDKAAAKDFMEFIHEITKVQHNGGEWKSGKAKLKLQLPANLFHSLNRSFSQFLPDEPGFAIGDMGDEDIRILYSIAPKLRGSTKRKRKS